MLSLGSSGSTVLLQGGGTSPLTILVIIALVGGGIYFALRKANNAKVGERFDAAADPSLSRQVSALMRRYKDAYIIARVTNGFGMLIKTIGIVIVVLLVLMGLMGISGSRGPMDIASIMAFVAIGLGIITGAWFYIVGVLIAAQGQILKASLDAAVNSSPFLSNEHKSKIMSLPEA
jgi:hypothetical protein